MTDGLRIRCAKLIGWKHHLDEFWSTPDKTVTHIRNIPNYPNDPAAAYELEEAIPEGKRADYVDYLRKILLQWDKNERSGIGVTEFDFAHATPEQRCQAFVKVMEG